VKVVVQAHRQMLSEMTYVKTFDNLVKKVSAPMLSVDASTQLCGCPWCSTTLSWLLQTMPNSK
jgi:hypothetical protein